MILIQVSEALQKNAPRLLPDLSFLKRAAEETLRQVAGQTTADVSLIIAEDAELQALNRQFLGVDAPTDVLSFSVDEIDVDTGRRYLGDVVLSYPRALAQAESAGHSLRDELILLVVHGVLHLLGYDHLQEADKAKMWALQDMLLKQLGCSILSPTA